MLHSGSHILPFSKEYLIFWCNLLYLAWQAFSFGLVSAERKTESQKVKEGEEGRGRKETPADKPLDFENLRSPANAATDWLG